MKKIVILISCIALLTTSCNDTSENQIKPENEVAIDDAHRYFFEGKYYTLSEQQTFEEVLESLEVTQIFYTSTDFGTAYLFKGKESFVSFLDKNYPRFDKSLLEDEPVVTDKENISSRTQCGEWGDFLMEFYRGSQFATTYCNLLPTYLMTFDHEIGFTPIEIFFKTPANGEMGAAIHAGYGGSRTWAGYTYPPTHVSLGPNSSLLVHNTVRSNSPPRTTSGRSIRWSLRRL